jgi:hypothetical protein
LFISPRSGARAHPTKARRGPRKGDAAGARADIAAAKTAKADIAETFARFGVK